MTKDDNILLRVTKGQKLLLKLYCENNKNLNNKNLNLNKLYEIALKEYFEKHNEIEIYSLITLVDKDIFENKHIKDIQCNLMNNEIYQKIMIKE